MRWAVDLNPPSPTALFSMGEQRGGGSFCMWSVLIGPGGTPHVHCPTSVPRHRSGLNHPWYILGNGFRRSKKQGLHSSFCLEFCSEVCWCYCQRISHNSPVPWASCCTESSLHFHYRACFPWWPGVALKHCSKWREPGKEIWRGCLGSRLDMCAQLLT